MDHEHMRRLHSGKGASFEKLTYQIALISKALIANDTWLFRFEKPEGFIYRAGQHARMSLLSPKRKELDGTFRFWSFASAPFETDLAFAVRMRPSAFKAELADLPVGMRVQIDVLKNVPHGAFALDDALTPIVFLAGGIGVVPAYSMIRQALHEGSKRRLTLLYSSRTADDAPFLQALKRLAVTHDNFHFIPTLTGSVSSGQWEGETGRISLDMVRRYIASPDEQVFYISGLKDMVQDLNAMLVRSGVNATAIRSEEFGAFSPSRLARKGHKGGLTIIGTGLLVLAALAAHLTPVWLLTDKHPLAWMKGHPVSMSVATLVLIIILMKLGLLMYLKSKNRRLH
ncbi:MAG: FAD-dependent oxidoreductase [Asticcacaulis sp.]|uniref:FAD-dependent oxidoreductase n=1 Tax=Asticcacaulis sp. TaxID=1872648 RepID=UPI003F7C313D